MNGVGPSGPSEYIEVPLGSLELPSEGNLSPNHAGNWENGEDDSGSLGWDELRIRIVTPSNPSMTNGSRRKKDGLRSNSDLLGRLVSLGRRREESSHWS